MTRPHVPRCAHDAVRARRECPPHAPWWPTSDATPDSPKGSSPHTPRPISVSIPLRPGARQLPSWISCAPAARVQTPSRPMYAVQSVAETQRQRPGVSRPIYASLACTPRLGASTCWCHAPCTRAPTPPQWPGTSTGTGTGTGAGHLRHGSGIPSPHSPA